MNVKSSHLLYKIKVKIGKLRKLKSRIASHKNKDSAPGEFNSDCATCFLIGVEILHSLVTLRAGRLSQLDLKDAFLHIGPVERDVHVISSEKSSNREYNFFGYSCLLLINFSMQTASGQLNPAP